MWVFSGAMTGHTVRCPWHGACFNVHTGDLEEYPGIDSLPCHKVHKDTFAFMHDCRIVNWIFFLPSAGQNSQQQSVRFSKQKGQFVNPHINPQGAEFCFYEGLLSLIQTLQQEKRIKTMGAAVPGFTHTVVLLGGGKCVCV